MRSVTIVQKKVSLFNLLIIIIIKQIVIKWVCVSVNGKIKWFKWNFGWIKYTNVRRELEI